MSVFLIPNDANDGNRGVEFSSDEIAKLRTMSSVINNYFLDFSEDTDTLLIPNYNRKMVETIRNFLFYDDIDLSDPTKVKGIISFMHEYDITYDAKVIHNQYLSLQLENIRNFLQSPTHYASKQLGKVVYFKPPQIILALNNQLYSYNLITSQFWAKNIDFDDWPDFASFTDPKYAINDQIIVTLYTNNANTFLEYYDLTTGQLLQTKSLPLPHTQIVDLNDQNDIVLEPQLMPGVSVENYFIRYNSNDYDNLIIDPFGDLTTSEHQFDDITNIFTRLYYPYVITAYALNITSTAHIFIQINNLTNPEHVLYTYVISLYSSMFTYKLFVRNNIIILSSYYFIARYSLIDNELKLLTMVSLHALLTNPSHHSTRLENLTASQVINLPIFAQLNMSMEYMNNLSTLQQLIVVEISADGNLALVQNNEHSQIYDISTNLLVPIASINTPVVDFISTDFSQYILPHYYEKYQIHNIHSKITPITAALLRAWSISRQDTHIWNDIDRRFNLIYDLGDTDEYQKLEEKNYTDSSCLITP